MKKLLIGAVIIAAVGFFIGRTANQLAPVLTGYGAKCMCSSVFIGGRGEASILEHELGQFPLSIGSYSVNYQDSMATGSVLGLAQAVAVYREGFGCTLARDISPEELRKRGGITLPRPVVPDTLSWPLGTQLADTLFEGVDYEALHNAVHESFEENDPEHKRNTRAVVVAYKGQLIHEQYREGFDKDSPQIGWSMTKSVTNAIIGNLSLQGKIDVYGRAPVDEWADPEDPRSAITVDQLLRMSSGLDWVEDYATSSPATNMLYKSADMAKAAIQVPLKYEPNAVWYYSSGTTNILSYIAREELGNEYHLFPYKNIFNKLGMRTVVMETDVSGTYVGSSYMWACARDWARFGQLYLNDGLWYGERILPQGWVAYSVSPTAGAPMGEYGAQIWLNAGEEGNPSNRIYPDAPQDLYMFDGYEGQRVFVIPSYDLVIVRLGQNNSDAFDFNAFLKSMLTAFKPNPS